jgi:hypothetical protein
LKLIKSIWFFPLVLTVILLLLTCLKISGSSIGIYHEYFYGDQKDPSLILNKPQQIRSDEWLANTPMTIAQAHNGFKRINQNIGSGQDMSVVLDVPYKEWSEIFKPHNWSFFVLPFDEAFAFKWWVMAYLLLLSIYFFVLTILPNKKALAVLLAIGFLFSPFVQWWYQYIVLAPIYYSLFIAIVFIILLRQQKLLPKLLLGLALSYLLVCFALVLYPPFQIACAIALGAFLFGYLLNQKSKSDIKDLLKSLLIPITSLVLAIVVILTFINTREPVIQTIQHTAYPGQRITKSGGYNWKEFWLGPYTLQLESTTRTVSLTKSSAGANPSELSTFTFFLPFLLIPSAYLIFINYRKNRTIDWELTLIGFTFLLLVVWMFVPGLNGFFKPLMLSKVPHQRLIIGLGLLNLIFTVLFIRNLDKKDHNFSIPAAGLFSLATFLFELGFGIYLKNNFPGFIGLSKGAILSFIIGCAIYLILRKKYVWFALVLAMLSILSTMRIHPLYKGTQVLTSTPLSRTIQQVGANDNGRWAFEGLYLENIASLNGEPSLSGLYSYPQFNLWKDFPSDRDKIIYNRYAHVNLIIDRNPAISVDTSIVYQGEDHFSVDTEPCSNFLQENRVKYLIVHSKLEGQDSCAHQIAQVNYPLLNTYIYKLDK